MLQKESISDVADNSGAKKVKCIGTLKGSRVNEAHIGGIITVAVQEALPNSKVSAGEVLRAVIVRSKVGIRRKDGTILRFSDNAVVLLNKQNELIGTRILGSVPRELRQYNFVKILSLAKEVL
jgi:large subunit ribosomal protein L14